MIPAFHDLDRDSSFEEHEAAALSPASRADAGWPAALSPGEIALAERTHGPARPLGVYTVPGAVACGRAYALHGGRVCVSASTVPAYWVALMEQGIEVPPDARRFVEREVREPVALFVSRDYNSWGHFWLDVAPRLHTLFRHAPERLRALRLAIPSDLSAWGRDALCALYGIDSTAFEAYDPDTEVLACRTALIPTMAHTSYAFHPAAADFYAHAAALCRPTPVEAGRRGLIYLTRRQFARTVAGRKVRLLENAADAEALATSLGFELVAPEELSWRQQIALFSRAKVVAGEHGSAMKGLLFAPRETCAVVINHLNSTQGDIAALRGQRCFILQANGFDPDRSLEPHRVDLSRLGACLEHALSLVEPAG